MSYRLPAGMYGFGSENGNPNTIPKVRSTVIISLTHSTVASAQIVQ